MTITQAITQFAAHRTAAGNSIKTINSYQRELHRLQRFLPEDYPVEQILANQLDNFLNSDLSQMRFDGGMRRPGSIANTKAALNSFFKWLQTTRHIEHNPAITVRIVKQRSLPTYLTSEEVKALLKTIKETRGWQSERDFAAVSILLHTGLRLSELTGLDVADVDLDENKIQVKRTKGGQPAVKHINAKLKKVLNQYLIHRLEAETECPALFLSQWNRRLTDRQFALRLEMWSKKADITKKVTPHVLRHTFATNLYAKTKNLLAVQKALGHEYITTTQIYTHIQDEELHNALESL